jgi:HSP20 family protein
MAIGESSFPAKELTDMSIAIREPWSLLSRFSREFDAVAAAPANKVAYIPAVDVREDKEQYVVQADLPGVAPADVEVTAEKGILTVRGERKSETREGAEGYARIERVAGTFSRRFVLPENVQADAIKAKFTNGVLEVSIPKQAVVPPTRVTVEAA